MKKFLLVPFIFSLLIFSVSLSARVGWSNRGWSGLNWSLKACNSETITYSSYGYASATAKIGGKYKQLEAYSTYANQKIHAVASSGYNETCYTWGNAY